MTTLPHFPDRFERVEAVAETALERSFRAFDRVLEQDVVVRLPAKQAWSGWSVPVRDRLLREARALAKVRHEAIAPILWVEETPEGPLMVQPPYEGEPLSERLRHGVLTVDETVSLGLRIAEALGAVHYAGIVHRGVGPDAIWLQPDGKARLGAFTFAKAFDARLPSSIDHGRREDPIAAAVLPPYPAPEQLAGRSADPRVDVWALGCVMYRCLCGEDPSGREGLMPDVRSRRKDVPRALSEVLRKCMHAAPTARYPTALAVADALRALTAQDQSQAGVSRRSIALAGAGALAIAVGLWGPWSGGGENPVRNQGGPYRPPVGGYSNTYDKAHVLLVGIAEAYAGGPHPELQGPVREIEEVEQRLLANDPALFGREGAITVLKEKEATVQRIAAELERIKSDAEDNDAVLVYFAGHGQCRELSDEFWLVTGEAEETVPVGTGGKGFLGRQALLDLEPHCRAKHVLVVLDCCYAGQVFQGGATRGRPAGADDDGRGGRRRASPYLSRKVCQFLVSASREDTARDSGPNGLSTFCQAFLDALDPERNPEAAYVPVGAIWSLMEQRMPDYQKPPPIETRGDSRGTFVFFLPRD